MGNQQMGHPGGNQPGQAQFVNYNPPEPQILELNNLIE